MTAKRFHDRDRTTRLLRRIAAGWAVLSLAALAVALATMSIDRSASVEAGAANLRELWPFWAASASGWAALTMLWIVLRRRTDRRRSESFGRIALLILGVAVAARLPVLTLHDPSLSDDVYRYVFDGRNAASGTNPYLVRPEERVDRGEEPDETVAEGVIPLPDALRDRAERWAGESLIVEFINNPELHTIYLPVSQAVFAVAGVLVPEQLADPDGAARIFRGVFVGIELIVMGLLLVALRTTGRSAWWLALWAWHPLAVSEIAGSGHQDVIGIALLVAAMTIYTATPQRVVRWIWSLALAALVKPVVVPIAAILLRGRSWAAWINALLIGAAICLAISGPLLFTHDGEPLENLKQTAERFGLKWAHFGSVYEPLLAGMQVIAPIEDEQAQWQRKEAQERLARQICVGLLGLVILGVFMRGRDAWLDAAIIFLAMVLLSPTAHPWYLLWALALLPIARSGAVWIASLTLPWGYAVLADPVDWSVPAWVMLVAYLPIYATLVMELIVHWRHPRRHPDE